MLLYQVIVSTFLGTLLQAKAAARYISVILTTTYCNIHYT